MPETPHEDSFTLLGDHWRHYAQCRSTNDLAMAWACAPVDPAPDGAAVTADYQTAGRGRRGRVWAARSGDNALLSIVCRNDDLRWLGVAAALAVADAAHSFGVDTRLKWPNDVLCRLNKLSGILVEKASNDALGSVAVVGIGVNVNQIEFEVDRPSPYPPTSLRAVLGSSVDVAEVCRRVQEQLLSRRLQLREEGPQALLASFRERLAVGCAVQRGSETGLLQDVLETGEALVRLGDGTFVRWLSVE
jgi:BirA family biotin operon repressor/biotin-[acetyl-CoA-carboxylase] ligase